MKLLFLVNTLGALSCCFGARILGILPTPSISHQLPFRLVMQALHARGHEITIITSDPVKKNLTNYNEVDVSFAYNYLKSTFDFTSMADKSPLELLDIFAPMGENICDLELSSTAVQDLIKSGQKFDVVILEALMYTSYYGLWHKVGSPPLIKFLSLGMWTPVHEFIGNPSNPSYCPEIFMPYSDHMTLWERFLNVYYKYKSLNIWNNDIRSSQEKLMRKYFGDEPPPIHESETNVSLVLVNNHWSMNFPRPYLPNVVELTGLHIQEQRTPLPQDMKIFLDGAKEGAIYFSLGTNVNGSSMPEEKKRAFIDAFSELPQRVLWKYEKGNIEGISDNIMVSKWFPQQDILAHPKVKLFITQCGLQSMNEAGYFGVPMITIPFIGDQGHNAAKVVKAGIGLKLEFRDVTKESVLSSIRSVLHEPRYRQAMDKFSAMYKDEPRKSVQRAVWWVEYVLRHNGAKHLRSAALDLHWTQRMLLDVLLVFVLVGLLGLVMVYVVLRWFIAIIMPKTKIKKL